MKIVKKLRRKPKVKIVKRSPETLEAAALPNHTVRYRTQPSHAAAVRSRALRAYRQGKKDFELAGSTVLRTLTCLDEYAENLPVRNELTKKTSYMQVIRLTVLAKLLNTSYQTIWRWTCDTQQLPEPVLIASLDRDRPVYHVEEVRVMVRAIGDHLNTFRYYRKDHAGTRDRIFHDIDQLRATNFGEVSNGKTHHQGQGPGSEARRIRKGGSRA